MKTVGIICEYNPFHTGHARQIEVLRERGVETVVCAMSGNFTQRGELAIADKYTRAEAAVKCGADIVVELPFPYSSFSAEGFARAGVHITASLGCDALSFGSESADTELLTRAAKVVKSEDFSDAYFEAQKHVGTAKAYFDTLSRILGEDVSFLSNDILAISYICEIERGGYDMKAYPVKREGSAYNSLTLNSRKHPSASAIRAAVQNSSDGFSSLTEDHLPARSLETLIDAHSKGIAPITLENCGEKILSFFRLMSPDEIISRAVSRSGGGNSVADDGCGIVERLCLSAKKSRDYNEFLQNSYNSRYTDARINRVMLFSLFGVSDIFKKAVPEYTILLGASKSGQKYLSSIRKTAEIPIITKPADAPCKVLTEILQAADSFYAESMPKAMNFDFFIKKHPFIY